jgi:hypothetical protein
MAGLVPAIHVFGLNIRSKSWMAGPSPRRSGYGRAGGTNPIMTS